MTRRSILVYTFSKWTDNIAAMSEKYQKALVELIDDSLVVYGTFDPVTNTRPIISGDPVFWSGKARIIPPNWGVNRQNSDTGNASTQTVVLVQFPKTSNFGDIDAPL